MLLPLIVHWQKQCFVNVKNQCSIVVTVTYVLAHADGTGLCLLRTTWPTAGSVVRPSETFSGPQFADYYPKGSVNMIW